MVLGTAGEVMVSKCPGAKSGCRQRQKFNQIDHHGNARYLCGILWNKRVESHVCFQTFLLALACGISTSSSGARFVLVASYTNTRSRMDFITRSCSDAIRLYAGSDKFIAARDVSGYVQMVLAPELATRLVMEDMNVDVERAREIMGESTDLGDLLSGGADSEMPLSSPDMELGSGKGSD
jgi:hypothetical protein